MLRKTLHLLQNFATKIEREQLQLVDVAAMFIASNEEMYAPETGDFVHITDRLFTEFQIRNGNQKSKKPGGMPCTQVIVYH